MHKRVLFQTLLKHDDDKTDDLLLIMKLWKLCLFWKVHLILGMIKVSDFVY